MLISKKSAWLLAAALFAVGPGCGGREAPGTVAEEAPPEAAESGGPLWQPSGNEGSVSGKVNFEGATPKFRVISMEADAACAARHSSAVYPEVVVVNDNGTLANVFIHVKSGLEGKSFAVPTEPVKLDQDGCIYKPHVVGMQARQEIAVTNSDDATHNIHPMPKVNREWNLSQPPGADPIVKSFSRAESSIPVKCNQHPWMRAYVHVISNPFYAVTGTDGSFELKGLPPGDYELEAVHERYGAATAQVTVEANGAATAEFSFTANQAYRPGSLKMMPALIVDCCGD